MRYTQACGFLILFCACDSSPGGGSNQAFDRGITSVPQQTDLNFVDAGSATDSSLTDAADAANGQDVCAAGGIFCVDEVTWPSAVTTVSAFNRRHPARQWSAASSSLASVGPLSVNP